MKKIRFGIAHEYVAAPVPTMQVLPEWYKKLANSITSVPKMSLPPFGDKTVIKSCMPFLDAMTSGYVVTLPQDVEIIQVNGSPMIRWADKPDMAETRSKNEGNDRLPVPIGHNGQHFTWKTLVAIKLPNGYSALITHPLNRHDLPFTTLSGIVDADTTISEGSLPFFIRENFEGVIKRGTPMFQILPFKRESWESDVSKSVLAEGRKNNWLSVTTSSGWYKHNAWKRKSYK